MNKTYDDYISNPMLVNNAVFSNRDMYRNMYTEKFNKVRLREAGKIDYQLFYNKRNDKFYIHIKIPSEVVPKFTYDVVIEFFTDNNAYRANASLNKYNVRFYSNDPSFVFTYLYVFKKNDMFITQLSKRSAKLSLKQAPKETNPQGVTMYVKSLYFAYLFMKSKNLFNKSFYKDHGMPYSESVLLKNVRNADDVIKDRQEKGAELKKEKEKTSKTKSIGRKEGEELSKEVKKSNITNKSKITPKTKTSKSINIIKKK